MRSVSLRSRLTIWYSFALFVALCLFGADVLWHQRRLGLRRVDRELNVIANTLANVIRDEMKDNADLESVARELRDAVTVPGRAVAVFDTSGKVLAARWNRLEGREPPPPPSAPVIETRQSGGAAWRIRTETRTFDAATLVLLVGAPLADVRQEQREVQEAMLIGIPIVLLIAGAGGLWLASLGLRPIAEMAQRAARIPPTGMEDLGRLDRTDELGQLAEAFNGLVARLRTALQTQRQFMADASHELRTPVSVVRAAAEVTLGRELRDESEYREALTIVGGQAHRLSRLVEDMLVLARADAGGYPLRPVDLYLDDVIAECRRAVDVLAAERGVAITSGAADEIPFRGDEDLLRRLVLNVLQNAVQHTPAGGSVGIDVRDEPAAVTIRVVDQGPGIPAGEQHRIFERFVQLDPARRGRGSGLGLPIARWIAEAHGGTLMLEASGPSGSTFCISLPRAIA